PDRIAPIPIKSGILGDNRLERLIGSIVPQASLLASLSPQ
ncbi:MAG: hypothetical protein ACI9MB_003367, partial [Verrucomicrobiales bacterium]